jgi:hypothetical protein
MKTEDEVEELKRQWKLDPWDDLHLTPGYEEWAHDLEAFVIAYNAVLEEKEKMRNMRQRLSWWQLQLNETFALSPAQSITRVPGGWIYAYSIYGEDGTSASTTFIPFSTEFQI